MSEDNKTNTRGKNKTVLEYVWLGGKNEFRSKIRVVNSVITCINDIPVWNYDGSSTGQATTESSDVMLMPCAAYMNPLTQGLLVLCSTYTPDGTPLPNNHRHNAVEVFKKDLESEPWFAIEQEYFLYDNPMKQSEAKPLGYEIHKYTEQGQFYCGVGSRNVFGRAIAETHLSACLKAGLAITGINAEVACGQWEYQIGPCVGVECGDQVLVSRYLLEKISELQGINIVWDAKPISDRNGSGCHVNYSTKSMRQEGGLEVIHKAIEKLGEKHDEHMKVYGENNRLRMSGTHETASYDTFSWGVADRSASVRIGHITNKNGCGYLEDRRPDSTIDPYQVTSKIFETTVL
jgi:glutamine synthetase